MILPSTLSQNDSSTGCEVIHLGHDKSAEEVVTQHYTRRCQCYTAYVFIKVDTTNILNTSTIFLREKLASNQDFWRRWRCNSPEEIKDLMNYGIDRIYSPDDGREMGLQGMIDDLVQKSDFATAKTSLLQISKISLIFEDSKSIAQVISAVENFSMRKTRIGRSIKGKSKSIQIFQSSGLQELEALENLL